MSGAFRVTPRAASDLRDIARYTLRTWGRKQRDAYLREMDKRFAVLAENPTLGKPRPDIREGYRSYPQGSHVIFYLVRLTPACDICPQGRTAHEASQAALRV